MIDAQEDTPAFESEVYDLWLMSGLHEKACRYAARFSQHPETAIAFALWKRVPLNWAVEACR